LNLHEIHRQPLLLRQKQAVDAKGLLDLKRIKPVGLHSVRRQTEKLEQRLRQLLEQLTKEGIGFHRACSHRSEKPRGLLMRTPGLAISINRQLYFFSLI